MFKQFSLTFALLLAACSTQSTYSEMAPSWVNSLRSGDSTLKLINGDKILFRSNFKSNKISDREELCNLSIEQNEQFIRKTYPHSQTIPMTVELRYYDPVIKDCSTTISVPRSFVDGENDADKKVVGVQGKNTGILNLTTMPTSQANVYIDDMPFSQSNSNIKIALTAGTHTLKVDHRNYEAFEQKITISAKGEYPVSIKLIPSKVNVMVDVLNSDVKADVFLNDIYKGKTPLTVPVEINQDNVFTLRHDEFLENSVTLKSSDMRRGDNVKLNNIALTEKSSYVSFTSDPDDAEVFIDGKKAGMTPLEKYEISRGVHRFEVLKNGFFSAKGDFNAVGGQSVAKNLRLNRDMDVQFTILETPAQKTTKKEINENKVSPAKEKNVSSVKEKKSDVVLRDKYHTYEFKEHSLKWPVMPNAATREDIIMALMRWDYADQLIKSSVSYNPQGEFFIRIFLDDEIYKKTVYEKMTQILKKIPEKSDVCSVKKQGQTNCMEGIEVAKSVASNRVRRYYDHSLRIYMTVTEESADIKDFNIQFLKDKKYQSIPSVLDRVLKLTMEFENGKKRIVSIPFQIKKFSIMTSGEIRFIPKLIFVPKKYVEALKQEANDFLLLRIERNPQNIKKLSITFEDK